MEWAIVVNLADEVEGLACSIDRKADGDGCILGIVNGHLCCSNLRLLPPMESKGVAIWIQGTTGVKVYYRTSLGMEYNR